MTGVLLINMGGPGSQQEMKRFLANMFRDPFILPFSKPVRRLLSYVISTSRYKKSWKKYLAIGGTPIISATQKTVDALQFALSDSYKVRMAFSYSSPSIEDSLLAFKQEAINQITIIPLYPQAGLSTTSSVSADVAKVISKHKELKITFVEEFYQHPGFVQFWSELITNHIAANQYKHPLLMFSAHSIPTYLIDKGDTYPGAIEKSALLIAQSVGAGFDCAYQSGMRRGKWLTPDVKVRLKELSETGSKEIVIIPISFVNENLETLYDIDLEIIPYAKKELGMKAISRVTIPEAHPLFIQLLVDLVKN
jgi:ferrochelatase